MFKDKERDGSRGGSAEVTLACSWCELEFTRSARTVKWQAKNLASDKRYCGTACSGKGSRRSLELSPPANRKCAHCNKMYYRPGRKRRPDGPSYCTPDHMRKHREGKKGGN